MEEQFEKQLHVITREIWASGLFQSVTDSMKAFSNFADALEYPLAPPNRHARRASKHSKQAKTEYWKKRT